LAIFLPCYLFTFIPASYFKYGKLPAIKNFVDGVTAGDRGAISWQYGCWLKGKIVAAIAG
jgi:chromate transporter